MSARRTCTFTPPDTDGYSYPDLLFSTKISTGCLWIEIAFDLSVFGLTLARTLRAVADDEALGLVRTVFRMEFFISW